MPDTSDLNRRLELRDATGTVVEVFLPAQTVQELQKKMAGLQSQLDQLRQERDALREDRDSYLHALHVAYRERVKPVTEEELANLKTNGIAQEQLLQEIDALFPPTSGG